MIHFASIAELRDTVYSKFLDALDLFDNHYEDLINRGLSDDLIICNKYKSIPHGFVARRQLAKDLHDFFGSNLFKVPGFYNCDFNDGTWGPMMVAVDGFLIPQRTRDGKVWAIYIRQDDIDGSKKYLHFSCKNLNNVDLKPRVHWSLGNFSDDMIVLTEGPLKADVSAAFLKTQIVAIPGVTMWKFFMAALEKTCFKIIRLANDRDLEEKSQVARPTAYLFRWLITQGYVVELGIWNNKCKGLDDALNAGEDIKWFNADEAKSYLEKVFQRLGMREIDWDGNEDIETSFASKKWMPKISLPQIYIPAPELCQSLVPPVLKDWVIDAADRMQSHAEFILGPFIVVLSGVIGRRLGIRPKQKDNWVVTPNLWGIIVGQPSSLKTPCIGESRKAIDAITKEYDDDFKLEMIRWRVEESTLLSQRKSLEDKMKNLFRKEVVDSERLKGYQEELERIELEIEAAKPKKKRIYINDSTIEMVQEILRDNPNGIIYLRDEIYGLIKSLDKAGRENDRSFLLEAWNGQGRYYVDRVGRGSFLIPALCMSLIGGIQPELLKRYLIDGVDNGSTDDGFIQRFQITIWPEALTDWVCVDRPPNKQAFERVCKIVKKLVTLEVSSDSNEIPTLQFDDEAQIIYYDWQRKLETRLRSGEVKPVSLEAHLGKFRSLVPSLALIFHVISYCDHHQEIEGSSVGVESINLAIDWADYLEGHAVKVYTHATSKAAIGADMLAQKIKTGVIRSGDTIRSVYRHNWSCLSSKKLVMNACEILEQHGWARAITKQNEKGGAISTIIEVNPEVIEIKY